LRKTARIGLETVFMMKKELSIGLKCGNQEDDKENSKNNRNYLNLRLG